MSYPSNPDILHERQIHAFFGYLTVAASILTTGGTIALVLSQYKRACCSFSTRQGVQKKRLARLFLGLAVACFFIVTAFKYVDAGARAEVADTLACGFGEGVKTGSQKRWEANEDGQNVIQVEVPSRSVQIASPVLIGVRADCDSSLERTYIAVKQQTWLSRWLNEKLPYDFELSVDAGTTLVKWLPPFQSPADYWCSSEYYWGALIWLFFLSYESKLFFSGSACKQLTLIRSPSTSSSVEHTHLAYPSIWLC